MAKKEIKEAKDEKEGGASSAKSKVAAIVKTDNFKIFGIIGLALVFVACLCIGLVFGLRSCMGVDGVLGLDPVTVNGYRQQGMVGSFSETVGTVQRNKPVEGVHDGGVESGYPVYGSTKAGLTSEQKDAILAENNLICAKPTITAAGTYDWMDENGYLYTGTREDPTPLNRQIYKHTASVGLYLGDVSDDEPAVVKKLTFRPRSYSSYYNVTGLYAPAGEVIKIRISETDMNATGGVVVHIGQALFNGKANNIWKERDFNRMPIVLNTMNVTKDTAKLESDGYYTAYVGSFLGGPIYVRDEGVTFSVEISGAVNYAHFILGVTTEEEYNNLMKSSAPYFDLEVWDSGVLHSGPKTYAKNLSYDDIYKAAVLWEKVSLVSTKVKNQGIVFLYDPFVAAGAAVAFPGQRSVNCPLSWMTSSLNYSAMVTSGSWGNFHEYHHNFQGYGGVGYTGEVTNNALNLVSYSLFTKVSSARQMPSYGGAGLSGWNTYTSATWALYRVNSGQIINEDGANTNGLAVYATLLHNLGQDAFIKSKGWGNDYFNSWASNTHQNFSYFASEISAYSGELALSENDYPLFVPVSSVYQTGRSYIYDGEKRYIQTMQPYSIPVGEPYTVDLREYTVNGANQYESGSIVIGNGFKYSIKEVKSDGINGTFVKAEDGVYTFTPNSETRSGKIYVTLEITTADGEKSWQGHALNDVDLVLEFEQSHELNKAMLERTVYTYAEGACPVSAKEAFEAGYSGYVNKAETDNVNPTQNSNTDVWFTGEVPLNSVLEVRGKLYFPEAGKYRIAFRGRWNVALFLSFDGGKNFMFAAEVKDNSSANFLLTEGTYYDCEVSAQSWVYFKEVMVCARSGGKGSYFGLGLGQWTTPMYTTTTDEDGNVHYWNGSGQEVSAEEAGNTDPVPPTSVTYATAYRNSYEFTKEFESDYFYKATYNFNYLGDVTTVTDGLTQTYVAEKSNYTPWDDNEVYAIENLLDGDPATGIHTGRQFFVGAENPALFTVDLGREVTANSLVLYPNNLNDNCRLAFPKDFTLQGSLDGEEWFDMGSWTGKSAPAESASFDLSNSYTFRYYKLSVTATRSNSARVALADIKLTYSLRLTGNGNNFFSPDDDMFTYKGDWQVKACNSHFGHVYAGKNATSEFEFDGTRFAILSSKFYGRNFVVYIDGKEVSSAEIKADDGDFSVAYLSPELSKGKHKIVIYCPEEGNIDAVAVW